MKKTVVRPFEAGSLLLALVGFVFPAILIYEAVSVILKGPAPVRIAVIAVAAMLTYFISLSALKIIFMSKFTFYEDHFEAVYFDPFANHAKTFYKPMSAHKVSVYYDDIEKFGSFESKQLRRNGRDLSNRLSALANVDGDLVPFVLPVWFQDSRNYFIINDKLGNGYLIDGKLYSAAQVTRVLKKLEYASRKSAVGGYPEPNNNIGIKVLLIFVFMLAVPMGLIELEKLLNPQHVPAYQSGFRTGYIIGALLLIFSVLFRIMLSSKDMQDDEDSLKRPKIISSLVSLALFAVTVVCFILSVMQ